MLSVKKDTIGKKETDSNYGQSTKYLFGFVPRSLQNSEGVQYRFHLKENSFLSSPVLCVSHKYLFTIFDVKKYPQMIQRR
jgi:hypothetical protein